MSHATHGTYATYGEGPRGTRMFDICLTLAGAMSDSARPEIRFEGVGVSPGMACGKIHVVRDDLDDVVRYRIAPSQVQTK